MINPKTPLEVDGIEGKAFFSNYTDNISFLTVVSDRKEPKIGMASVGLKNEDLANAVQQLGIGADHDTIIDLCIAKVSLGFAAGKMPSEIVDELEAMKR